MVRKELSVDLTFSPRLLALQASAAGFAQRLMALEEECETQNGLSAARLEIIRRDVVACGLAAFNLPTELGGGGMSNLEQVVVQEELGKVTNGLWDVVWRPANALLACTPRQRERWLLPCVDGRRREAVAITEPAAGSDPSAPATTAERVGDRFRLNGEKWFVTVGDHADFLLVLATVPGEGPTFFIFDKDLPGVRIKRTPGYMHNFVFEHPEFEFTDVDLGQENVLGVLGAGNSLTHSWLTAERLWIAARCVGAAERAMTHAVDWAKNRIQGGAPIMSYQMIQAMIADSAVEIALNRALVRQVACEFDSGGDPKTLHAKAAMVKLAASEAAGRVIDRAVQIFGGRGYMREQPVERLYRDIRVDRIWEGTSEIQRLIIANEINKRGLAGLVSPAGTQADTGSASGQQQTNTFVPA
jgi:butyryl-CoA dehydrogenase